MAYSNFTSLDQVEARLGLRNKATELFAEVTPHPPSEWLKTALAIAHELPLKSEKAKSEWIIVPILTEVRNRNHKLFTIYSGDTLNADEEKGLNGECDFILAKDTGSLSISYPIIHILEAKKGDIEVGIPQCAAQLVGARLYNERKGAPSEFLYGCVTTGKDWLFLRLQEELLIDRTTYYLAEIDVLLGVFQTIIDLYTAPTANAEPSSGLPN